MIVRGLSNYVTPLNQPVYIIQQKKKRENKKNIPHDLKDRQRTGVKDMFSMRNNEPRLLGKCWIINFEHSMYRLSTNAKETVRFIRNEGGTLT
jgi:hypothetical protein